MYTNERAAYFSYIIMDGIVGGYSYLVEPILLLLQISYAFLPW